MDGRTDEWARASGLGSVERRVEGVGDRERLD